MSPGPRPRPELDPAIREAEIQHYLPALDPALPTIIAGDFNEGDGGRRHHGMAR